MSNILRRILLPKALHFVQQIGPTAPWLVSLIRKIGTTSIGLKMASSLLHNKGGIDAYFKTDLISARVEDLKKKGGGTIHFWVLCVEGMGDVVSCEPISRYLRSIAPDAVIHWIIRDSFRELIEGNPLVDDVVIVKTLSDGYKIAVSETNKAEAILVNCHMDGSRCSITKKIIYNPANPQINVLNYLDAGPLLSAFSLAAGLPRLDTSPKFWFVKNLTAPINVRYSYVAIHCRSNGVTKDWASDKWLALVAKINALGLHVVEVGITKCVFSDSPLYIDYTGKRRLQDIAWIIDKASVFVGIDSGFAHMANAVKTASVILLGNSGGKEGRDIYSGDFSKSRMFKKIRPTENCPVSSIDIKSVYEEVLLLYLCQSKKG